MRNQLLFSALVTMSAMNIMAMELPPKKLGHRGATLKEIAVKHLIDHGNSDPCDHMDKLLVREDLYEVVCNDLKNGFCEKYKGYGFNQGFESRKIYDKYVIKSVMKDDTSVYVPDTCCIKELDVQSGAVLNVLAKGEGFINDFVYKNGIVITGLNCGGITLWNVKTNKCIKTLDLDEKVQSLATDNTNTLCSMSPKVIKIWDIASGRCNARTTVSNNKNYGNRCILNDGILYAINSGSWPSDNVIAWDFRSNKHSLLFSCSGLIQAIVVNKQFPFALFSGAGCKFAEWDLRNLSKPVYAVETDYCINNIATQGSMFYVGLSFYTEGHKDPGIKMLKIQSGKGITRINSLPGSDYISDLQAHSSGLYAASPLGLTVLTAKSSYENVYKELKNVSPQKALEDSKNYLKIIY